MLGLISRLIYKLTVIIKDVVLDFFIGMVPDIIFGREGV